MSNNLSSLPLKEQQALVNTEVRSALPEISTALQKKGISPALVSLGFTALKHNRLLSAKEYVALVDFGSKYKDPIAIIKAYGMSKRQTNTQFPSVLTVESLTADLAPSKPTQAQLSFEEQAPAPVKVAPTVPTPAAQPIPAKASLKTEKPTTATITPQPSAQMPTKSTAKSVSTPAPIAPASTVPATPPRHVKAASLADILGLSSPKPKINPKWATHYAKLQSQREEIASALRDSQDTEITRTGSADVNDMASASQGAQQHLAIHSLKAQAIQDIDAALKRIERNTYGICEFTNEPIEASRLEASPATRYSFAGEQQYQSERRNLLQRNQVGALIPLSTMDAEAKEKDVPEVDDEITEKDTDDTDEKDTDDVDLEVDDDAVESPDDEDLTDQKPAPHGFTVVGEDEDEKEKPAARVKRKPKQDLDR